MRINTDGGIHAKLLKCQVPPHLGPDVRGGEWLLLSTSFGGGTLEALVT